LQKIEVHLSKSYIVIMVLTGLFTCGFTIIFMWFTARCWPAVIDEEGITMRSGKRVYWRDLTEQRRVRVVRGGSRVTGRLDLIFGKTVVQIVPHSLKEGPEVMQFLSELFGENVTTG